MNKLAGAVLLVLLGLGVGLWLGFDPQARAMVQENATQASKSFALVRSDVSAQVNALTAPDSGAGMQVKQEPSGSSGISLNLNVQQVWNEARQLWLSFISKFRLKA